MGPKDRKCKIIKRKAKATKTVRTTASTFVIYSRFNCDRQREESIEGQRMHGICKAKWHKYRQYLIGRYPRPKRQKNGLIFYEWFRTVLNTCLILSLFGNWTDFPATDTTRYTMSTFWKRTALKVFPRQSILRRPRRDYFGIHAGKKYGGILRCGITREDSQRAKKRPERMQQRR